MLLVEWKRETEVPEEKPSATSVSPPQISHNLTGDRIEAAWTEGQRSITVAMSGTKVQILLQQMEMLFSIVQKFYVDNLKLSSTLKTWQPVHSIST